ncbi:MAG: T9SS type B sorting domain-containing protein, partial [Bacteroidota bacterium]
PQALTATATGQGAMAYSWTTSDGSLLEGSNTPTPLVGAPGNYRLSVIDATNGCTAEASLFAFQNLLDSFAFTFVAPDCRVPTGSLRFTEVVGGTAPFVYSFDGGRSFANATEAEGLSPGRYNLRIQDLNGCELTQEAIIPNPPELELMLGNRVVLPLGEGFQIRPQTNFSTEQLEVINWTPTVTLDCADCLQPLATPTESTLYTLNLISKDGCTATDSLEVIVTKRRDIYFPTAFSPNGDGRNDRFLPLGDTKLIAVINDFNIHDRWGNILFAVPELQPNDPIGGWDGRHRGRLVNPATFVYSAKVTFIDGVQQVFEGSFTLLR